MEFSELNLIYKMRGIIKHLLSGYDIYFSNAEEQYFLHNIALNYNSEYKPNLICEPKLDLRYRGSVDLVYKIDPVNNTSTEFFEEILQILKNKENELRNKT